MQRSKMLIEPSFDIKCFVIYKRGVDLLPNIIRFAWCFFYKIDTTEGSIPCFARLEPLAEAINRKPPLFFKFMGRRLSAYQAKHGLSTNRKLIR